MSTSWMAAQLNVMADRRLLSQRELENLPRYNPRPGGVPIEGSTTDVILKVMQEHPLTWFTHAQLMRLTGRSTKAIGWSLRYLVSTGHIEPRKTDERNPRYLRHRLVIKNEGTPIA